MNINSSRPAESSVVPVQAANHPIEQQILAAGNLSQAQLEAIRGFQRRKGLTFGEAARNYGVVIYDTAPALESADAYVVASRVGSAILLARRHRSKVKDLKTVSQALQGFQCDVAGSVLCQF